MIREILKRYWIYSIRAVALLSLAGGLVFCAFSGYEDMDFIHSFFAPEVASHGRINPYYRSLQYYYKDDTLFTQSDFTEVNIKEWRSFFDDKMSADDLRALLYEKAGDQEYIDNLMLYAHDEKYPLSERWKKNSINTINDLPKRLEFLRYLRFAKQCEPYATMKERQAWEAWRYDWTAQDTLDMTARIEIQTEGNKFSDSYHIPFIRQRFHFQMIRLHFLNKEDDECISYWRTHRKEIEEAGTAVIKCRSWSYVATALYRQKKYAEANYLFAMIFDQIPTMQRTALYYFHPMEEKDWNECLAMAKNPHERAVLWEIAGIQGDDELRAIQEIYKIDPSSEVLDLLITRLVNRSEEGYLGERYQFVVYIWGDNPGIKKTAIDESLDKLKTMMDDSHLHNRPLWYLSVGYLCQMQGNYEMANTYYDKAVALAPKDALLGQQAQVLRIVANAELIKVLDEKKENEVLAGLQWLKQKHDSSLRTESAHAAVRGIISRLYKMQGNPVMAELAQGFNVDYYLQDSNVYNMISFYDKPNKRPLEEYLMRTYEKTKGDMWDYLGLEDVYKGDLNAALQKWDAFPPSDEKLPADPFLIHMSDCNYCDEQAPQAVKYSRLELLTRMVALDRQGSSGGSNAAQAYFQLANAYYNITYYGNNRMFYVNNITGSLNAFHLDRLDVYTGSQDTSKFKPDVMDCSLALKYYLKARDASSDKEFKAKCTYMAAKCEHNMSGAILLRYENGKYSFNADADFGKYFKELKDKYTETQYEKEVIRECSYFRGYLSLGK